MGTHKSKKIIGTLQLCNAPIFFYLNKLKQTADNSFGRYVNFFSGRTFWQAWHCQNRAE